MEKREGEGEIRSRSIDASVPPPCDAMFRYVELTFNFVLKSKEKEKEL